jgi:hypothetical protein
MVGREDIYGRQRRWRWFWLCFKRFLLGSFLERFLAEVFADVLLKRDFLCAKRKRGNEQKQHRSDTFLSHFLLWVLVTVRESEKQEVINANPHFGSELLHLGIGSQLLQLLVRKVLHAGNVSITAIGTNEHGRIKVRRFEGKTLSVSSFLPFRFPIRMSLDRILPFLPAQLNGTQATTPVQQLAVTPEQ